MPKIRFLPQGVPLLSVDDDWTADFRNQVIAADASTVDPLIVTLPPVASDRSIEIVVVNAGASGTVTVDAFGAELIDGNPTYSLTAQWDAVTLTSTAGGWVLSAGGGGGGGEVYDDSNPEFPGLGVTTFQGAVESLLVGAPSTTFIYNSSSPSQGGTRYNDWADLMAALALSQYGGPRNILFEQNETIPVGTYDLTDITLLGNGFGFLEGGLVATFQDGCSLTNDILRVGSGLTVDYSGSGYLMDGTDDHQVVKQIVLSDRASVRCSGTDAAFVGIGSTAAVDPCDGEVQLIARSGVACAFVGESALGPNVPDGYIVGALTATSGTRKVVVIDDGSQSIYANTLISITGNNNVGLDVFQPSPTLDPVAGSNVFAADADTFSGIGVLGTPGVLITSDSTRMRYAPAVPGNWTTQPTTVQEALDMIAAWANPVP